MNGEGAFDEVVLVAKVEVEEGKVFKVNKVDADLLEE
jgi:hypothetical protein